MKLMLISDIHARYLSPENRTDDFFEALLYKLGQVRKIADKHKCEAILQAGDLFDSPEPSRYVQSKILREVRKLKVPIYTVIGQHDMIFRNWKNLDRTATYLLESAGVLTIVGLDGEPVDLGGGVLVHGLSFEQDFALPKPVEGKFNILIAHASVGTRPLYPGHVLPSPREFIHKHPGFDMVIVGDIHYAFEDKFKDTQIFNTGCMMRKTVKKEDLEHKPCVFVYDTATREYEKVLLKIKPWQEIFHIPEEKSQPADNKLQEFIDAIRSEKKLAVSYYDNQMAYYKKNSVTNRIQELIASAMERAGMSVKEREEIK